MDSKQFPSPLLESQRISQLAPPLLATSDMPQLASSPIAQSLSHAVDGAYSRQKITKPVTLGLSQVLGGQTSMADGVVPSSATQTDPAFAVHPYFYQPVSLISMDAQWKQLLGKVMCLQQQLCRYIMSIHQRLQRFQVDAASCSIL